MIVPWRQMEPAERVRHVVSHSWRAAIPPLSILLAVLIGARFPIVSPLPVLPDLGLPMLLAWRLYQPSLMPIWAALPLGLFADLAQVHPLGIDGTAWPLALVAVEMLGRRFIGATLATDWIVATGAVVISLLAEWRLSIFVNGSGGLLSLLPRMMLEILVMPLAARMVLFIETRLLLPR